MVSFVVEGPLACEDTMIVDGRHELKCIIHSALLCSYSWLLCVSFTLYIVSRAIVQGSATSKMWLKVALLKLPVVLRHGASSAPAVDSESDV